MHLHGHDFRVLNGQGEYALLKISLTLCQWKPTHWSLMPMDGDWFFTVISHITWWVAWEGFSVIRIKPNPYIPNLNWRSESCLPTTGRWSWFRMILLIMVTTGEMMLQNTRWSIGGECGLDIMICTGTKQKHTLEDLLAVCSGYALIGFD